MIDQRSQTTGWSKFRQTNKFSETDKKALDKKFLLQR